MIPRIRGSRRETGRWRASHSRDTFPSLIAQSRVLGFPWPVAARRASHRAGLCRPVQGDPPTGHRDSFVASVVPVLTTPCWNAQLVRFLVGGTLAKRDLRLLVEEHFAGRAGARQPVDETDSHETEVDDGLLEAIFS